ncbi:uncharacterized protein LOC132062312 [Lycium ferocissimum]|uniref:uncharacterized protein LOC132062312 n=1 Tax=Lycium ferocissimum TaxID=112874 RepID=UPI002814F2A8|nr:uncharacterized protein LOC132062312 [Lycium ferocissimum]
MQAYGRMKRVTDPFDDKMKAWIIGRDPQETCYLSSGSEHSAYAVDDDDDDASCGFSNLIFGFPDDVAENALSESDSNSDDEDVSACKEMNLEHNTTSKANSRGLKPIHSHGLVAVGRSRASIDLLLSTQLLKKGMRKWGRAIRGFGYNTAICKTKWESSGGLKAGNYEFIDVIRSDNNTRYIIDLDFAAEFEIARPTNHYEQLLKSLPNVFVGKSEELKCILKVMSDGARLSLRNKELLIPPWRKNRFMQNKWLGAYKRTINILPSVNDSSALLVQLKQINVEAFNAAVTTV